MIYKIMYVFNKGLFFCFISEEQKKIFKKNKRKFVNFGKVKLSIKQQLELFDFLSLYYSDGENVYGLLTKYQQFVEKKTRRICKFILSELRRGKDFSEILRKSQLFDNEIGSYLSVVSKVGITTNHYCELAALLRLKLKKQNELVKKLLYPLLLVVAGIGMVIFASYNIIPNFLFFFQDSGQEIPIILRIISKEHLWKTGLVFLLVALFFYVIFRVLPSKIKSKIPMIKVFLKSQFQLLFWRLCIISVENGLSFEEVVEENLGNQDSGFMVYYLSTILARLKRGLPFEEAINIDVIDKKQRILTAMSTDNERKKQLYINFLREAEEEKEKTYNFLATVVSSFALLLMGSIILLLGYVMIVPLSQISNII